MHGSIWRLAYVPGSAWVGVHEQMLPAVRLAGGTDYGPATSAGAGPGTQACRLNVHFLCGMWQDFMPPLTAGSGWGGLADVSGLQQWL